MPREPKRKPRIVAVDDEADFLAILRDWLTPQYELVTFLDGEGLHERLEDLEPDALILDVMLPGCNGFEICRRIATDWRFQSMPIIFLTACQSDADFFENVAAGGTTYLTKPVTRAALLARIKESLSDARVRS